MSEKIKFLKTTVFFEGNVMSPVGLPVTQLEILAPLNSISHMVYVQNGNSQAGFNVYFKDTEFHFGARIRSINPAHLPLEHVHLLNKG